MWLGAPEWRSPRVGSSESFCAVGEDAVARVEAAVVSIGYTPHGGAQSLRLGRSRLIGLVVPNVANPHFAAVAREV